MSDLLEDLAALEHEQWAGWAKHMLGKSWPCADIPSALVSWHRWEAQADTPYADLSEADKEKDREFARKVLAVLYKYSPKEVHNAMLAAAEESEDAEERSAAKQ